MQINRFLIIGNGRMAKHFLKYCQYLNIETDLWYRQQPSDQLSAQANLSSHIFILIKDGEIENFILKHKLNQLNKILIHFSGSLTTDLANSAHPLMTFGPEVYDRLTYEKILFVCEKHKAPFEKILPGLKNPHAYIEGKDKAYYHCLGSLANNFTTILWQTYFNELKDKFGINPEDVFPILEQTLINLKKDYKNALTGPLIRKDTKTIDKHLKTLKDHPLEDIYNGFVKLFSFNQDSKHESN
jgi:predicted short-subunit dehydrogenase-like oxidoreductase (DUF2520 family)